MRAIPIHRGPRPSNNVEVTYGWTLVKFREEVSYAATWHYIPAAPVEYSGFKILFSSVFVHGRLPGLPPNHTRCDQDQNRTGGGPF